jgi:hypothetical protein
MKKYKLQQWLPFFIAMAFFAGCSKKNYLQTSAADIDNKYKNTKTASAYTAPQVITISDELAKSNRDGEMYFDNEHGYRYWRFCDGKYYLDSKYESGASPDKKSAKKKLKKQSKKNTTEHEAEDVVNQ